MAARRSTLSPAGSRGEKGDKNKAGCPSAASQIRRYEHTLLLLDEMVWITADQSQICLDFSPIRVLNDVATIDTITYRERAVRRVSRY